MRGRERRSTRSRHSAMSGCSRPRPWRAAKSPPLKAHVTRIPQEKLPDARRYPKHGTPALECGRFRIGGGRFAWTVVVCVCAFTGKACCPLFGRVRWSRSKAARRKRSVPERSCWRGVTAGFFCIAWWLLVRRTAFGSAAIPCLAPILPILPKHSWESWCAEFNAQPLKGHLT